MRTDVLLSLALGVLGSGLGAQERTFTHEKDWARLPVRSQDRTGTCWSFATVSFLESELLRLHGRPIDLSEMFPVYHAYLEKGRTYVRLHGKAQFSQGGLCHDVLHVVRRHGLAPAKSYSGLCPGDRRHDHGEMERVLEGVLEAVVDGPSDKWEAAYRGVLDAYLGPVPGSVTVGERTMTPREYAREELELPLDDYLTMMSFEHQPFWRRTELQVPDNWLRYDEYLNVPIDAAMTSLDHALENGFTVAVDMDVSERGFEAREGIAEVPSRRSGAIDDALRQRLFDRRSTTDDHLMHIVGLARDEDGDRYYVTKNSWGEVGPYDGLLYMSRDYVALKMLSFMAHRDAFPDEIMERFEQRE